MRKIKGLSLLNKVKEGLIENTGAKPKLPTNISDLNEETLEVYRIPLEFLYYNDRNGRIASAILRIDKNIQPTYDFDDESYNNRIEQLIFEENTSALRKTKQSIKDRGQQIFGYVLDDGRVIDGNRRFTALRKIAKETGTTQYFEAVILPFTYNKKTDRSKVKQLELAIQMGVEEKQKYDNVDAAVDIYQTVEIEKLMTVADYAKEANKRVKTIDEQLQTIKLIRNFLDFINADTNSYFIIKDTGTYSLFKEAIPPLNKIYPNGGPSLEEAMEKFFSFVLLQVHSGTSTRAYASRDYFKDIVSSSETNSQFYKETDDAIDDLRDILEEEKIFSTPELKSKLSEAITPLREVNTSYNKIVNKQKRDANTEGFLNNVRNISDSLSDMLKSDGLPGNLTFQQFNIKQLREIRELLIKINAESKELIEIYDDEI